MTFLLPGRAPCPRSVTWIRSFQIKLVQRSLLRLSSRRIASFRSTACLLLDELPDHLDLESINAWKIALQEYDGAMLLVAR